MSDKPEAWLRGPVEGIDPYLIPAAHIFLQVREDVAKAASTLGADELWKRPGGAASVGFHLRHIAGAIDRLLTYARGEKLSPAQVEKARSEQGSASEGEDAESLVSLVEKAMDDALEELRKTRGETLLEPRAVGKAGLPSTVLGLLFHAAEHAQRHTGQIIATAKAVRG